MPPARSTSRTRRSTRRGSPRTRRSSSSGWAPSGGSPWMDSTTGSGTSSTSSRTPRTGCSSTTTPAASRPPGPRSNSPGSGRAVSRPSASYSYQVVREDATDETAVNSPQHLAKARVLAPLIAETLMLGAEARYQSERKTAGGGEVGGSTVVDATLSTGPALFKWVELTVSVRNLLDVLRRPDRRRLRGRSGPADGPDLPGRRDGPLLATPGAAAMTADRSEARLPGRRRAQRGGWRSACSRWRSRRPRLRRPQPPAKRCSTNTR